MFDVLIKNKNKWKLNTPQDPGIRKRQEFI